MGMFRDSGSQEIDIVKEMAEGLGSQGLKLEDLLERTTAARERVQNMVRCYQSSEAACEAYDISEVNDSIREYNSLVDRAEDALRWLLIQREACGFRTHRNVNLHYPIPSKMKLLKA
jgi:predicted RNA-binding protein with EMAP domain